MAARTTIRAATADDDLATYADIVNEVTPEDPTSVTEMTWADRTYPGGVWLLAEQDGRAVGAGSVGRIYAYPEDYPDLSGSIVVRAGARRQGVGSALLTAIRVHASAAGKTGLQFRAFADRPDGIDFLEHRGFTELERARMVRLTLAGLARPVVELPPGIRLTSLAARPELVAGVHAVALETFEDIPGGDDPMVAGDLAEFRARDVDRDSIPADAFMVALDEATDEVVAYASLMFVPGSTTVAWHDMTAVRRAWRGRGLATALKLATIAWAIDHGLAALETGNDVDNAPMRAVNARLGYTPLPDELTMRGPVAGPAAGTSPDDAAS